jgi:hypothetical protein
MAHYRLYALDCEGHFGRAADFECSTDEEALGRASEPAKQLGGVALWRIGHCGKLLKAFTGRPPGH